mgnify:CR=1 FL=1
MPTLPFGEVVPGHRVQCREVLREDVHVLVLRRGTVDRRQDAEYVGRIAGAHRRQVGGDGEVFWPSPCRESCRVIGLTLFTFKMLNLSPALNVSPAVALTQSRVPLWLLPWTVTAPAQVPAVWEYRLVRSRRSRSPRVCPGIPL